MIISRKHNYIYFRPKKTGSSTIEQVLGCDIGPDDIIGGQKHSRFPNLKPEVIFDDLAAHTKAVEIRALVSEEFWNDSFKFASVRHPYEKAVSLAFFKLSKRIKTGGASEKDFPKVLDNVVKHGNYSSEGIYSIGGVSVVDDFIRHETFDADFRRVLAKIGIPAPSDFPRKKGYVRSDRRPASEILNPEQKKTVYEICRDEFDLLGYE